MSSSLTLKVTSALSRDGVSCEASNPHGNDRHVFHFGTGEPAQPWEQAPVRVAGALLADLLPLCPAPQWPPRPPRPEWRSWPWLSAWASCSSSLLLSTA